MEQVRKLIEHVIKNKRFFSRLVFLIGFVVGGFILIQNVSCGYSKTSGFWFKWIPAATVTIDKKV
jgi:hypothetical protein